METIVAVSQDSRRESIAQASCQLQSTMMKNLCLTSFFNDTLLDSISAG
jgi:hypothetical protein